MPNGGIDDCSTCGFNSLNNGEFGPRQNKTYSRTRCTIRGIPIWDAYWTYCANWHTKETTPLGPMFSNGLYEEGYSRIPYYKNIRPTLVFESSYKEKTGVRCIVCNKYSESGIVIKADEGDLTFCNNAHYVSWWKEQFPTESLIWDNTIRKN